MDIPKPQETHQAAEADSPVMQFLDARTHEERLRILNSLRDKVTDSMIDTMAVSLDLQIGAGDLDQRYDELRHCLQTKERYEVERGRFR